VVLKSHGPSYEYILPTNLPSQINKINLSPCPPLLAPRYQQPSYTAVSPGSPSTSHTTSHTTFPWRSSTGSRMARWSITLQRLGMRKRSLRMWLRWCGGMRWVGWGGCECVRANIWVRRVGKRRRRMRRRWRRFWMMWRLLRMGRRCLLLGRSSDNWVGSKGTSSKVHFTTKSIHQYSLTQYPHLTRLCHPPI